MENMIFDQFALFEKIQNAYEISTMSNNQFEKLVNKIKWNDKFHCEDGYYFILNHRNGDFTLNCDTLDPFTMDRKPEVFFSDGSYMEV